MELYYVTDGVVHNNALNYKIPVPSTIDNVNFNWISLANRPVRIHKSKYVDIKFELYDFSYHTI